MRIVIARQTAKWTIPLRLVLAILLMGFPLTKEALAQSPHIEKVIVSHATTNDGWIPICDNTGTDMTNELTWDGNQNSH
jgi:hypothetical protein